jgi:hypothetical protein
MARLWSVVTDRCTGLQERMKAVLMMASDKDTGVRWPVRMLRFRGRDTVIH